MKIDISRYVISLIVTISIFATSFYVANFFNSKKIDSISNIGDSISVNIMSNETQFLLKEISCTEDNFNPVAGQLEELGDKLTYAESNFGSDDDRVIYLKKYYSLLQIRDYLIGKKMGDKCGKNKKPIFIIYMYPSKIDCEDCGKQASILTELRKNYPELRVYTFDYDLDLQPIQTLKTIYKIDSNSTSTNIFPVLVIEDKAYYGLRNYSDIESLLPTRLIENSSSTASTTLNNKTKTSLNLNSDSALKSFGNLFE